MPTTVVEESETDARFVLRPEGLGEIEVIARRGHRWHPYRVTGVHRIARGYGRALVYDARQAPLLLFESEYALRSVMDEEKDVAFHAVAP